MTLKTPLSPLTREQRKLMQSAAYEHLTPTEFRAMLVRGVRATGSDLILLTDRRGSWRDPESAAPKR